MKEKEIIAKYRFDNNEFVKFVWYLRRNNLEFSESFTGAIVVEDRLIDGYVTAFRQDSSLSAEEKARKAAQAAQEKAQQAALEAQENARKKQAMSQMLISSGFNFDGYRIVKYSGYISGDDAMTVSRGSAWTDGGVRDKLMASLTEIRRNALRELKEAAYDLGCNAIIGVDFDYITLDPQTANLSGGTTYQPYVFCVTANGNAVVIEKIEE